MPTVVTIGGQGNRKGLIEELITTKANEEHEGVGWCEGKGLKCARMKSAEPKYPMATIAPYGPNNRQATKLVVAIFPRWQDEPSAIRKWFVESGDVRENPQINAEVVEFMKAQRVVQSVMADRIIGCPHEEGIDYPEGESCPECPFWAGVDRFTHEKKEETTEGRKEKIGRNEPCPCGSGKKFKKCCG